MASPVSRKRSRPAAWSALAFAVVATCSEGFMLCPSVSSRCCKRALRNHENAWPKRAAGMSIPESRVVNATKPGSAGAAAADAADAAVRGAVREVVTSAGRALDTGVAGPGGGGGGALWGGGSSSRSSSGGGGNGGARWAADASSPNAAGVWTDPADAMSQLPWTEIEDWLVQDTFPRYAIGSGKHVMWRRMVMEVPELLGRTPAQARSRWLRLTGRERQSEGGIGSADAAVGGAESAEAPAPGGGVWKTADRAAAAGRAAPWALDAFYLQPVVLEEWEELEDGSFRGIMFGQRGLADGTVVRTATVDSSGRRIEDQHVTTQCGVVFELGRPKGVRELPAAGAAAVAGPALTLARGAPFLALAAAAAVAGITVLTHHVQLEVFVV